MKAGIVIYKRVGTLLVGKWAHEDSLGLFSEEIVRDVQLGTWEGDWPVEIFQERKLIFRGRLNSVKLGDCLKLKWQQEPDSDGGARIFQGIGYAIDAETVAASFELIEPN
ncbi:hypothetical protein NKI39_15645 [Mesorhizobium sp. M0664]|uniref:hypothetical protein n=1 Tax=Mesorhizobium sp. M0664 TaxID=2956982 RepID=UPI00333DDFDC